ncbi:MAG: hypothetical protein ACK5LC_01995 [Coprobacillaceae bacterium]
MFSWLETTDFLGDDEETEEKKKHRRRSNYYEGRMEDVEDLITDIQNKINDLKDNYGMYQYRETVGRNYTFKYGYTETRETLMENIRSSIEDLDAALIRLKSSKTSLENRYINHKAKG